MPGYSQYSTYELEQKRAELYAEIERLQAEYTAMGLEINSRILAGDLPLSEDQLRAQIARLQAQLDRHNPPSLSGRGGLFARLLGR